MRPLPNAPGLLEACRSLAPRLAWLAALLCTAVLLVYLSHAFTREGGRVASVWPLNAVVLAVLLWLPRSQWSAVFATVILGNAGVNIAMHDSLPVALLLTGANAAEILVCAHLLHRDTARLDITRPADLARFVVAAAVAGPTISAALAGVVLSGARPFAETFPAWFIADALGMLVFGPAALVLAPYVARLKWPEIPLKTAAASACVLIASLLIVFTQSKYPLLFLVPPALILATFRLGLAGAAGGVLLTSVVAIGFTVAGYGPAQLIDGPEAERADLVQIFLAVMSLATLPVASAIAQAQRAAAAAMAQTRHSEAHYRALADHSNDLVLRFDGDGVISYASPASRMLGFTPEELIGRSPVDLVAPEDRDFAARVRADLYAGPEPDREIRRQFRVLRKDGSRIWLEGSPNIIRDATGKPVDIVSTYRDISEHRELEDALRRETARAEEAAAAAQASEARYKALSDSSLDMIARIDLDATIRFVSPSCEVLLGYTAEELVGTRTIDHMHPEDLPRVIKFFTKLLADGPAAEPRPYRYRARRRDGCYIWLEGIPRYLYDDAGRAIEVQDSARDVTVRETLQAELRAAKLAAEEARVAAENAARAKGDFLAMMSHELRTPLASIIGFSGLLMRNAALAPADARHVDLIATSSQGLLAIVNDILDFSSLEAGGVRLAKGPLSVSRLTRRCLEALSIQADASNLVLQCEIADTVGAAHLGDETRLNQVLINLVGNAIKFTETGSVTVRVTADDAKGGIQRLRFEISDTGIGIPADRLDLLFTRFSQLDASIGRRFGGTGLGLAISKYLVELMGGEIGVVSRQGVGSTFWFSLPLAIMAADALVGPGAPYAVNRSGPRRRVLVVDDFDLNRELAVALLSEAAHMVDVADGGVAAIERAKERPYDIVFMDVQMPGMDGLAATRAIRALPGWAHLPIVAMTAQALPEQIAACMAAGMTDHVAKPMAPESLHAMIAAYAAGPPQPQTKSLDDVMVNLRARFLERTRNDLAAMAALLAEGPDARRDEIRHLVHRFAGTAGTFGFPDIGERATAIDRRLAVGDALDRTDYEPLMDALEAVLRAA